MASLFIPQSMFVIANLAIAVRVSMWQLQYAVRLARQQFMKLKRVHVVYTDGEAVIMLAFQASGRGSTPLRCIFFVLLHGAKNKSKYLF